MRSSTTTQPVHTRSSESVRLYAFGGIGEVGMNLLGLEVGSDMIILDCGVMFQDMDSALGLEFVLPNLDALTPFRDRLRGVVFTHGHEDHIGAAGLFMQKFPQVPFFASALTRDLIVSRGDDFPQLRRKKIQEYVSGTTFPVGHMRVTPVLVSHSIPDSHGLVIDTAAGRIIMSGDFRYDYESHRTFARKFPKQNYFAPYLDQPILCYLGDSTNVSSKHVMLTEQAVAKELVNVIRNQGDGMLVITLFSSNMERLGAILDAAHTLKKKAMLCGRSVKRYLEVAQNHNLVPKYSGLIIEEQKLDHYPRRDVVAIATGSQAEPKSALMRMAMSTHHAVRLQEGDQVVMSSKFIPGNERPISRMINALLMQGVSVLTEKEAPIHTSGHAYEEESVLTLETIRPQFFVPVHGEYHHLVHHTKLAKSLGRKAPQHTVLMHNGQAVELSESGYHFLPEFDATKWTYDCGMAMSVHSPWISHRKRLARHGLVICSLTPKLTLFGLGIPVERALVTACEAFLAQLQASGALDPRGYLEPVRGFLRRYFRQHFDKRPYVLMLENAFMPYDVDFPAVE